MNGQTFGLTTNSATVELNNTLKSIQKWQKKSEARPTWLDKQSFEALSEKQFNLYMEQNSGKGDNNLLSWLEVTLPDFGRPVLYCD